MDGVGSLVLQTQPLCELSERWPHSRPNDPVRGSSPSASSSPQPDFSLPLVTAPQTTSASIAPLAPSFGALQKLATAVAPGGGSLPPLAQPGTLAQPVPSPAVIALRRANRIHRRRYVLADPFGLHRTKSTKRAKGRRGDPALPARLADLLMSRHDLARVSHRLGQHNFGWHWFRSAFFGPIASRDLQEYKRLHASGLKPMAALVLTGLMAHTSLLVSRRKRAGLIDGLGLLNPQEVAQVAKFLFAHPGAARNIRRTYMVQERLELYQGGDSFATYLRFARHFGHHRVALPETAKARAEVLGTAIQLAPSPALVGAAWRAHGRTLHFTDAAGRSMGLKLRKDATDATALEREDVMDQCFAKWQPVLGLLGHFPKSLGLLLFAPDRPMRAAVAAQAGAHGAPQFDIGTAALMPALLYQTPPDYHVHLHETPTLEDLRVASYKTLHDAGTLAGRIGLVHMSPADFYHNREKDRRWYWNVDQVKKAVAGRGGDWPFGSCGCGGALLQRRSQWFARFETLRIL